MNELVPEFKESLFPKIEDISQDYMEIGIDSIMQEGIIKELPIVKTIFSGGKTLMAIRERKLMRNLYIFIKELNDGSIDEEKKKKYQNKINNNSKLAEKELERLLILLEQYIDTEKAVILAKLFKAYINEEISWKDFCEFSEIVNRIFIQDIILLEKIKNQNIDLITNKEDEFRVERLYSLGLIGVNFMPLHDEKLKNEAMNHIRTLSALGIKFCKYIFVESKN